MRSKINSFQLIIVLIFCLALFIRLIKLNIPLLEFYPSRQVQTAEIARNFYKYDLNIMNPTVSYLGAGQTPYLIEFPGYNFAIAITYKIINSDDELVGRLFSIAGWIVSFVLLYKISKLLISNEATMVTLFFYAFSPLSILVSRSFQPDQWMLSFSLISIYFLLRWQKSNKVIYLLFSAILASASILLKIPSLIFTLLPISVFLYKSKNISNNINFLYILLAMIPSIIWYVLAFFARDSSAISSGNFAISNWFGFDIFINPNYYTNIFGFEYNLVLLPLGMILFLM